MASKARFLVVDFAFPRLNVAKDASRRKWLRLAVALAATLLALFAVELGLRLYNGQRILITYTIQRNSAYFSPRLDDQSPLYYTYSGIETDDATEVSVRYPGGKTRSFGYKKPSDTFRVVTVGDSITELWNLPGYVNYTRLCLKRRLSGVS
jgi:hypothetical protein